MPADNDVNELDDDDDDFEDASPSDADTGDGSAEDGGGKPGGFSSAPPWARKALPIGVALVVLYVMFVWLPGRHHESSAPEPTKATTTTAAATDPLANRPKVNPIVSAVVGKDAAVRQKIADVVKQAEKQASGDNVLCSLYWGMAGGGWSIEYQRPGGPALPNFTWNVPLFVDTHCFPTVTSPLVEFAAIPPVATAAPQGGSALSNTHPPLTPTGDR